MSASPPSCPAVAARSPSQPPPSLPAQLVPASLAAWRRTHVAGSETDNRSPRAQPNASTASSMAFP
eukprot:68926-Rhodomonas_salina.2